MSIGPRRSRVSRTTARTRWRCHVDYVLDGSLGGNASQLGFGSRDGHDVRAGLTSASAVARPIPRPAPVTSATRAFGKDVSGSVIDGCCPPVAFPAVVDRAFEPDVTGCATGRSPHPVISVVERPSNISPPETSGHNDGQTNANGLDGRRLAGVETVLRDNL